MCTVHQIWCTFATSGSACLAFGEALGTYVPRLLAKCFSTLANLAIDRGACATYFARGPPIMLA